VLWRMAIILKANKVNLFVSSVFFFFVFWYHSPNPPRIKYPLLLSHSNKTWIFLIDFPKLHKYQISWKSDHWEPSCSIRTDGRTEWQTDMARLTVAFRDSANSLKKTTFTPAIYTCDLKL
jgi:hypothetical protein